VLFSARRGVHIPARLKPGFRGLASNALPDMFQ
jgi:hypothetical protein